MSQIYMGVGSGSRKVWLLSLNGVNRQYNWHGVEMAANHGTNQQQGYNQAWHHLSWILWGGGGVQH